jgi:hypothetical protein
MSHPNTLKTCGFANARSFSKLLQDYDMVQNRICYDFVHYYSIFYGGRQNRLTEVGKPTASEQRSRLILAFTKAVGQPPRLIT